MSAKYEFYQSPSTITFDVFIRSVSETKSVVSVVNDGQELQLRLVKDGTDVEGETISEFSLILYGTVLNNVNLTFRSSKVEVRLTKADSSCFMWPSALKSSGVVQAPSIPLPMANLKIQEPSRVSESASISSEGSAASADKSYPTSSSKKKDWNAVEREINAEEESEKPQGEEALFKLFRSIYSNANEDTKRAMVKSFQTSGGTVLSTNWDEVSRKDFEKEGVQAPSGMEVKKYEQ